MARKKKIIVVGKQRAKLDAALMVQVIIALGKQAMQDGVDPSTSTGEEPCRNEASQ